MAIAVSRVLHQDSPQSLGSILGRESPNDVRVTLITNGMLAMHMPIQIGQGKRLSDVLPPFMTEPIVIAMAISHNKGLSSMR